MNLEWRTVVLHPSRVTGFQFANCPLCAALVPDWDDAKLCHERWHAPAEGDKPRPVKPDPVVRQVH